MPGRNYSSPQRTLESGGSSEPSANRKSGVKEDSNMNLQSSTADSLKAEDLTLSNLSLSVNDVELDRFLESSKST